MPYIPKIAREHILSMTLEQLCTTPLLDGEVNYIVSILLKRQFFAERCYKQANLLVGAVECAKMEFVRRYVNSYEDEKIISNGDI